MNKSKNFKKPLGRGLSSLLGDDLDISNFSSDKDIIKLKNIPMDMISPGPWQAREHFNSNEIKELSNSIKKNGLLQPILITPSKENNGKFLIIAGERRWRAAQIAKMHDIPAIIRKDLSEEKLIEISLLENLQRSDLNPIEEAIGYKKLLDSFNYTQEELSKTLGKSRPYITNIIRLLILPLEVQKFLIDEKLTIGHARALIGKKDAIQLSKEIIKKNLTVRDIEKNIKKNKKIKSQDENNLNLEKEISEKIGLKVKVNFNKKTKKGSISLICNNLDQFDHVIKKLKLF